MNLAFALLVASVLAQEKPHEAPARPIAFEGAVGLVGAGMRAAAPVPPYGVGVNLGGALISEIARPVTFFIRVDGDFIAYGGNQLGSECGWFWCTAFSAHGGARYNLSPHYFVELGAGFTRFGWLTQRFPSAESAMSGFTGALGIARRVGPMLAEAFALRAQGGVLIGPTGERGYALIVVLSFSASTRAFLSAL